MQNNPHHLRLNYNFAIAFDFANFPVLAEAIFVQEVEHSLFLAAVSSLSQQAVLQHFDLSQQLGVD